MRAHYDREMGKSRFNVVRKTWPRIYDLRTTRLRCFLIDGRWKRQGKKLYSRTLDEAKLKAEFLAQERQHRGIEALTFPTELRLMATQAQVKLQPWNATIDQQSRTTSDFLKVNKRGIRLCSSASASTATWQRGS